jgi:hypothetical protein
MNGARVYAALQRTIAIAWKHAPTPPRGTEIAATPRTIPRARALRRRAGVRISAAPSSSSLSPSPRSERRPPVEHVARLGPNTSARTRKEADVNTRTPVGFVGMGWHAPQALDSFPPSGVD